MLAWIALIVTALFMTFKAMNADPERRKFYYLSVSLSISAHRSSTEPNCNVANTSTGHSDPMHGFISGRRL